MTTEQARAAIGRFASACDEHGLVAAAFLGGSSSTSAPGAGHAGGLIVFEGTPADLVAARSTRTGEHLAAHVGT